MPSNKLHDKSQHRHLQYFMSSKKGNEMVAEPVFVVNPWQSSPAPTFVGLPDPRSPLTGDIGDLDY
jgi:hypothetical protein